MSKQNLTIFQMLGQTLLFTILAFCSFSVFAQDSDKSTLPYPFNSTNNGKDFSWLKCDVNDPVQQKILYEYGAVFLSKSFPVPVKSKESQKSYTIPCRFTEQEVGLFTENIRKSQGARITDWFYLQPAAAYSINNELGGFQKVARNCNAGSFQKPTVKQLIITIGKHCIGENTGFKINDDWALRSYKQTEDNWKLANRPENWDPKKPFTIKNSVTHSYPAFAKNKTNKPTMYSYAIPGSSQHHFGLAIDVNNGSYWNITEILKFSPKSQVVNDKVKKKLMLSETCDQQCTNTLNQNGWYRTVRYDAYHFTYLGVKYSGKNESELNNAKNAAENELENLGLKKVRCKDYTDINKIEYWVPKVTYKDEQNKDVPYEGYKNWECKQYVK